MLKKIKNTKERKQRKKKTKMKENEIKMKVQMTEWITIVQQEPEEK